MSTHFSFFSCGRERRRAGVLLKTIQASTIFVMQGIEKKIERIKQRFSSALSQEERYQELIAMGRELSPYPEQMKLPIYQVQGCQSTLYLYSEMKDGKLYFSAAADALISAGLATLLLFVYSGQAPETLLKTPPAFLAELGILSSLTPSRSNGLAHIHQRMKRDALMACVELQKTGA